MDGTASVAGAASVAGTGTGELTVRRGLAVVMNTQHRRDGLTEVDVAAHGRHLSQVQGHCQGTHSSRHLSSRHCSFLASRFVTQRRPVC